jgi:hypothetical protein
VMNVTNNECEMFFDHWSRDITDSTWGKSKLSDDLIDDEYIINPDVIYKLWIFWLSYIIVKKDSLYDSWKISRYERDCHSLFE